MCRVYRARVDRMMLEWVAPAAANQLPSLLEHHLVYPPTPGRSHPTPKPCLVKRRLLPHTLPPSLGTQA